MSSWFGKNGNRGKAPWHNAGAAPDGGNAVRDIARRAMIFVVLSVALAWLMSGLFVLQENQQALVFRWGKLHRVARAGVNWALPYPIETHEVVALAQSGSVAIGSAAVVQHSGLRDAQWLAADGSIVEAQLLAQYRVRDVGQYALNQAEGAEHVLQLAGASVVREVLATMDLATLMAGQPEPLARRVQARLQAVLDAAGSGIEITRVSAAADAIRVPQALQGAYQQLSQAREQKAQAAAQAASAASQAMAATQQEITRLHDAALAYKNRTLAAARAESAQFAAILPEYQKAPQAARDRLYYDAMQQVLSRMNKVVAESRNGVQPVQIALAPAGQGAAASAASAAGGAQKEAAAGSDAASAAAPGRNAAAGERTFNASRSRDPELLRQRR